MCPNVQDLEERLIDVKWNEKIKKQYPTNIVIHASNKSDILLDIISKTTKSSVSIRSINSYANKKDNTFEITVLVEKKEDLVKYMNELKSIKDIIDVERLIK